MKYDLSLLTDIEFQKLINQLVQKQYPDKTVEQFCEGPDGGKDGLIHLSSRRIKIIQSKHYLKSGFPKLYECLKTSEIPKIIRLRPKEYVLATSINLSAEQYKKIEELLKNNVPKTRFEIWGYTTIEAKMDLYPEIVKVNIKLWAQNVDIVKRILNPEAETSFACLQSRWKKIDKYFVPIKRINDFIDTLKKEHVLIITGEPGIGKTTLAENLCKLYFINGYKIEFINSKDFLKRIDLANEGKILYYFDDFLGSNYLSDIDNTIERQLVDILRQVKVYDNKRFILTSRTNILEKGKILSQELSDYHLKDVTIPIMSVDLTNDIKANILYNHLWHSELNQDIINFFVKTQKYRYVVEHDNFNPRIIEFITEKRNYEGTCEEYITFVVESLDNPKEIWKKCFERQLNECQRTLVKLVVANGGFIDEKKLIKAYNKARNVYNLVSISYESIEYPYVFSICENSILKKRISNPIFDEKKEFKISTYNPSVNDYFTPLLANVFELEKLISCLNSVECIEFICTLDFSGKITLLTRILDDCTKNIKVKLYALSELIKLNFRCSEKYIKRIILDTSFELNDIEKIILKIINRYDCSEFFEKKINSYLGDYEDIYNLFEKYFHSPFYNENIGEMIYDKFYDVIKKNLKDTLRSYDGFNECLTEEEGYDYLNGILDGYRYLRDEHRKALLESVDMRQEIDYNIEQQKVDDDESYEIIEDDFAYDIESLFNGLVNR